jgi:hypothetical protein
MNGALRAQVLSKHRFGSSNQESVYFQSSRAAAQLAAPGSYALPIRSSRVTHTQLCFVHRYRNGALWNQKTAHQWGKAASPDCPICGRPDSAEHMLSGPCSSSTHAGLVPERHNTLARIVLKAISKGTRGAELQAADVGSRLKPEKDLCNLQGLATVQETMASLLLRPVGPRAARKISGRKRTLVTSGKSPEEQAAPVDQANRCNAHLSRPDAVMRGAQGLTLIELKCCPDTRPEAQLERAREQHAALLAELESKGCKARVVVILCGVGGLTYQQHTLQALLDLGVQRDKALKTLEHMSVHAISASEHVYRTMLGLRSGLAGVG